MGVSAARASSPEAVIWHDLECGRYRADLHVWRELAGDAGRQPVLDVGAGTGRVALDLARRGHAVIALDRDAELLAALDLRAGGMPVETVRADALTFELARRELPLCIVPMQTIQLLDGAAERVAFMRRAHAHLCPGGLLALAIVTEVEAFDCANGGPGPTPEIGREGGAGYETRPVRVSVERDAITIERTRVVTPPEGAVRRAHDVVRLARVTARSLQRDGTAAGFAPAGTRAIEETAEHAGSLVVMLRA